MVNYYKNKFLINIVIILVFFSAIAIFIIYPALAEINRVNVEITSERVKLEKKLALGLNIKKIIRDLEEIENKTSNLDTIFVKRNQELDFVNDIENIANKYGISIDMNSDFTGDVIEANISRAEIQMVLRGSYPSIVKFIEEIENIPEYLSTTNIVISKDAKNDNSGVIAQLTSYMYLTK